MEIAIWIIAIVEVVRAIQNTLQLIALSKSSSQAEYKRATDAFIKSLDKTDEDFFRDMVMKEGRD